MNSNNSTNWNSQKKILIMEDDLILTLSLELMLKKAGFTQFERAEDAQSAISKVQNNDIDLIIADICLEAEVSGIDAVKKIQEQSSVPVIYITGNSDDQHRNLADETEYIDYLVKPISYDKLKKTIARVWDENPELK